MSNTLLLLGVAALSAVATAQLRSEYTTPVPILKQINRHNEDGSYSYGYEGADGSFKIETKFPDGQVLGKYGYVDDTGKVREVEYGASKRGFEVAGPGINVPPPTLVNNNNIDPNSPDYDDGQYREDPSIYYKAGGSASAPAAQRYNPPARPAPPPAYQAPAYQTPAYQAPAYQPAYQPQTYQQPAYQPTTYQPKTPSHVTRFFSQTAVPTPAPAPAPAPIQQNYYSPPQQYQYNSPATYSRPSYNPVPYQYDARQFAGHPASNIDITSGSYSVSYSGK